MNKKDTVIFDMDGTLMDSVEDLTNSTNYALEQMGYPLRTLAEVKGFVGNGIGVLIRKSLPEGVDEATIEKTIGIFKKHYVVHCNDCTKTYPGIDDLIVALDERGIKMAIVSNKGDFAVKELMKNYFDGRIPVAIGEMESEGIRRKPAPDTVFKAMELLGSKPEDSVYVGDTEVDLQTARNAGLDLILCTWGFRKEEFLQTLGAEAIIHHPMELIDVIS